MNALSFQVPFGVLFTLLVVGIYYFWVRKPSKQ